MAYKVVGTDENGVFPPRAEAHIAALIAAAGGGGGGGGGSVFLSVAASNASAVSQANADYLCDGTNDHVEINAAIAALPSTGGKVVLSEGDFNIASSILIQNDNVTLVGAGAGQRSGGTQSGNGSRLKAATGITSSVVKVQRAANDRPVYGVLLRDFTVDGNTTGAAVDGVYFRSNRGHIDHVHVHRTTGSGVRVQGYSSPVWDTYDTILAHVQVGDCSDSGIYLDTNANDVHLQSCILYNNNYNIRLKGSSAQIVSCHTYDAITNNIFFDGGGSRTKITACKIEGAGQHGINIDSTNGGYSDIQITGNGLNTNGDSADNTYDHIILQGPSANGIGRTEIVGNAFGHKTSITANKARYGINLNSSSSQSTTIIGNTFGPSPIYLSGSTQQIATLPIRDNSNSSFPAYIRANQGAPNNNSSSDDGMLNVKLSPYNAKGDGVTDDTSAIQSAFSAATTGSTIYFPPGTYLVDTLTMSSKTNVTVLAPNAVLKRIASPTNHMIRIGESGACTNLRFDIAEIDGNNFAGTSGSGTAIVYRNTNGFTFNGYIHHTWNHAIATSTTAVSNVKIDLRAEFIGRGYTADNTFSASSPHGCAVYFAGSAPVTDGDVTLRGTDIKGMAGVYVAGCTRLVVRLTDVRRTGYRGLFCTGTNTVVGLHVPNPQIEDCGAVYESSTTPGASLYGQGTNGIYTGLAPVTAQDAVITGGKINKCGETALEGKFMSIGLVAENTGFAYTSFGSGLAKEGVHTSNGSRLLGARLITPGVYGVHASDSSTGLSDIQVESVEIIGATSKSVYFQQDVTGTANDVVLNNITCRKGTASPTHGIHFAATGGGSVGSRCFIKDTLTINTFSTAGVLSDATGGGTNTAVIVATDNETIRDVIGATLTNGPGITVVPDDASDTITISATGGGGGGANSDVVLSVAANDTPAGLKANADYVCDGTNDHVEIQAALDTLQLGTGGEVFLLPGTFNTAATVVVGVNGNSTLPVMLRFAAGALIKWSSVTGRTPIVSIQGWLCDLFNPSIQGSGTKGNGIGVQMGGTGNTVHGCTVWSPKISACDTGVEFGIVGTSSSGECSVVGGRISNVKTGVQSNAFVNYVELCFISGVNVGVRQSADRSSGKVVVSNTTINEWADAAIELLRGRGSVFNNIWMEHTSVQSGTATEIIRLSPTGSDTVVNPTFTGVTHLHALSSGAGTQEVYGVRLSGNVEGLYAEHFEFTDESVSSALIRQDSTHVGVRNVIKEVSFGDPIPSGWTYSKLLSNASSGGRVIIQEIPAPAGSPAGLTVGATTPVPSGATYYIDKSGNPNSALYWAKRFDGHVAAMAQDTSTTSGLKSVLEGLATNDIAFQFGPGRYHFLDAPLGSEGWAGVEDHASYVSCRGLNFIGSGMDVTTISGRSNVTSGNDTEPFSFSNCQDVTIRDLTVESCGFYRTTTDAIDFDQGARCLVERVRIRRSRSRAIVFDGGDSGKNAVNNIVRDCVIQGRPEKPQLSIVSGGTLTASTSYRYMVSWTDPDLAGANSAGETKPSEVAEITTDTTNKSVRVYLQPGPYGCTERRIYRAPTGSSSWVRVTTIADNTTTQYIDTGGAGTSVTMPVSHRSTIPQAGVELLGSSGNKIIDNFIDGVGDDPVGNSGFGIHMIRKGSGTTYEPSDRNLVRGNHIVQSVSNGVKVNGGSDNMIHHNMVINPGTQASKVQSIRLDGVAGITTTARNWVFGNRCIDDQDSSSWTTGQTTSNTILINNVGTVLGNIVEGNFLDAGASTPVINDPGGATSASIIRNNTGYNPQGPATITVGASPFTYTGGPTPEMVYIYGGTVSSVTKSGFTLSNSSPTQVRLEPNQSLIVTYSSAPTMNKDRL